VLVLVLRFYAYSDGGVYSLCVPKLQIIKLIKKEKSIVHDTN